RFLSEQETRPRNKSRKTRRKVMPQYLVCNYMPDDFDPSVITEEMMEQIHALNREMIAAGVRKFACGIAPPASAKTLRTQRDGKVLVTDGPYTETKEHMGGFWILECANMDEALAWAKKGAIVCDVAGEVRELLFFPAPE
ncbi:MAG: YciI family protein, partial [Terracidiphilus sp.]